MGSFLKHIILFILLKSFFFTYAFDYYTFKNDLSGKEGKERYEYLISSIKKLPADSIDKKINFYRFTLKKTKKDDYYLGRLYLNLAKLLLYKEIPRCALDTIFLAKDHIDITNDSLALGSYFNTLSMYYEKLTDFNKAIIVVDSAIIIYKRLKKNNELSMSYSRKGVYYHKKQDWDNAIKNYKISEKLNIKLNDNNKLYSTYANLALVYKNIRQYDKAVYYHNKAMQIAKDLNIKLDVMHYFNLASLYMLADNDYLKAKEILLPIYNDLTFKIFNVKEIGVDDIKSLKIKDSDEFFAFAIIAQRMFAINCHLKADVDSVFYYAKIAYGAIVAYKDNELKKSGDIISTYKDKAVLEKKQMETNMEIKQQRLVIFVFSAFSILIILFLFFYYKANKSLGLKNRLIKKQQENIIDSINYASRIQQSILIPEEDIRKTLNNFFAYYKPKDIVSGDFYWHYSNNDLDIIAVVDCTGHGVPGAFMSMIGNTLLNEIIIEKRILDP